MAEVLYAPRQPDGQSYYQASGLRRSSSSSTMLYRGTSSQSSTPRPSSSASTTSGSRIDGAEKSSSHSHASEQSHTSSATNGSLKDRHSPKQASMNIDTTIAAPRGSSTNSATPLPSPASHDDTTDVSSTGSSESDSPLATPNTCDDLAVKDAPSRAVDFLAHEWREEDIWSSWRHIVCNRKEYGEYSRLENASWRSWGKTKHNLRTINPENLNWFKDSDITWLYGPLKLATSYPVSQDVSDPSSRMSKSNSFITKKKPILKKRTQSEIMLQQSISTSSLLREAATSALFAQRRQPRRSDASSEFSESKLPSEAPSRDQADYFTSRSSSFCDTPCTGEKKHIRFDNVVEQCIAIDHKDLVFDGEEEPYLYADTDTSSDDEDALTMKRNSHPMAFRPSGSRSNSNSGRRIIETLPATTLKENADDLPTFGEQSQHHTFGSDQSLLPGNKGLSPSASSETLRPSRYNKGHLVASHDNTAADDDEDGASDDDYAWSFGASNPRSSLGASTSRGRNNGRSSGSRSHTPAGRGHHYDDDEYDDTFSVEGMRRTGSGMFMPYDDGEESAAATGIFGRVSETINTARDIAHVIWTVGWRT